MMSVAGGRILDNSPETKTYLEKLPKVYLIVCYAGYAVREFPFSGSYSDKENTIPLVWDHYDGNGSIDEWHLMSITNTTTGGILGWTFSGKVAREYAHFKNIEKGEAWRNV